MEPYILAGYINEKTDWDFEDKDYSETIVRDPSTLAVLSRSTNDSKTTRSHTFKRDKNITGTAGVRIPVGGHNSDSGAGGLDISLSFMGQTTYRVGGFVRFGG